MDPICAPLQSISADVANLCDRMISQGLRTTSQIDTGVKSVDFVSSPPSQYTLANSKANNVLEKAEVYSAVIGLLEKEEFAAFQSSSFTTNSFPFSNYVSLNTSFMVPWLLSKDTPLLTRIASHIGSLKSQLSQQYALGSSDYNTTLAKSLTQYVKDPKGLNVRHMQCASREWTAHEAITQSHEADCSEFALIYYELCRLAGLDAKIAQVTVNSHGVSSYHLCVALHLDHNNPSAVTLVDLTRLQPFGIGHREWVELPKLSVVAYYYMNRGLQPPAQTPEARFQFARQSLETAMALDGTLPLVHFNMGNLYYQFRTLGNDFLLTARMYLEESLKLDPDYPDATTRLDQVLEAMK